MPQRHPKRAPRHPIGLDELPADAALPPQPPPTRPRLRVAYRPHNPADAVGLQKRCSKLPPKYTSPSAHQKEISPATPFASGTDFRWDRAVRPAVQAANPQDEPVRCPCHDLFHSPRPKADLRWVDFGVPLPPPLPRLCVMGGLGSCSRPRLLEQHPQAHSSLLIVNQCSAPFCRLNLVSSWALRSRSV